MSIEGPAIPTHSALPLPGPDPTPASALPHPPERRDAPAAAPVWLRLAPVIFLLIWSAGFPAGKVAVGHTQPITLLVLRFGCVLVLLGPLTLLLRPPRPSGAPAWRRLAISAICIQVLYFGGSYLALATGESSGAVALIVSLQPILVALFAPSLAGERVPLSRWLGLALGLGGAALVVVARATVEIVSPAGVFFAVVALLGMTAGTIYEKRGSSPQHPVMSNLIQYLIGFLVVLPVALVLEEMHVDWSPGFAAALAWLVLGNSLIALSLLLAMIRHGEVARVSALFFLVPPTASLIAWLLIGEAMPPLAWLGLAIATLGVALATSPMPFLHRRSRSDRLYRTPRPTG